MEKIYTLEERREALKLVDEIGKAAAAWRFGINVDTLYGWRVRRNKNHERLDEQLTGRSEAALINIWLWAFLRQAQQDVEILQEALSFLPRAGNTTD